MIWSFSGIFSTFQSIPAYACIPSHITGPVARIRCIIVPARRPGLRRAKRDMTNRSPPIGSNIEIPVAPGAKSTMLESTLVH